MPYLKLIVGLKGTGKTKAFISLVNETLESEKGDIVCVERGSRLTYDLPHSVRLIESTEYDFPNFDFLKGFISGLHSGNYDITHIFIDSLLKVSGQAYGPEAEEFFDWVDAFGAKHGIRFTLLVSADLGSVSEHTAQYL